MLIQSTVSRTRREAKQIPRAPEPPGPLPRGGHPQLDPGSDRQNQRDHVSRVPGWVPGWRRIWAELGYDIRLFVPAIG